jgi:uncharacterized protein with ParB-like and HNH nuclease domain
MIQSVDTELLTLQRVVEQKYQFIIPSYQRPYVWTSDEIKRLLDDIHSAYVLKEPHYFVGSTLTARRSILLENENVDVLELIDGQQRTTTLMLFSLACMSLKENITHPILDVASIHKHPRLHFEIRENVQAFLQEHAGLAKVKAKQVPSVQEDEYLEKIAAGLVVIRQYLEAMNNHGLLNGYLDYVYHHVTWVNNIVPRNIDLNKIFTSINTAGVQLEPVDLVKAKLFKKINIDKVLYSEIWDICQNMNQYFERLLKGKITIESWKNLSFTDLAKYQPLKINFLCLRNSSDVEQLDLSISKIFDDFKSDTNNENIIFEKEIKSIVTKSGNDEINYDFRSFLSFDLLLIHALRIYKIQSNLGVDIQQRMTGAKLQEIFDDFLKEADEVHIKAFIQSLWQVRYLFDRFVVRWIEDEDNRLEELVLTNISALDKNDSYPRSKKKYSALQQLQSVCIFTTDRNAHYWLTPYLMELLKVFEQHGDKIRDEDALSILEKIDNTLSLTTLTQKEASYLLAQGVDVAQESFDSIKANLNNPQGTSFKHYWFQKLEYTLWKAIKYSNLMQCRDKKQFEGYRITSKNSIEHIHPQNEKYGVVLADQYLHAFGNLALLSPSQNSEYSNKPVRVKKEEFYAKPVYDSLKLKNLFDHLVSDSKELDIKMIIEHQQDMLNVLEQHYKGEGVTWSV